MINFYKGSIVKESLDDDQILDEFKTLDILITKEENPADRWHIYTVETSREQLEKLSHALKPNKWYAHFWDSDGNIIAVFRDKIFEFNFNDKQSWQPAIKHGLSVGIPKEQLDFLIN